MSLGRVVAGLVVIAVALAAVVLTASRQESYRATAGVTAVPRETLAPSIDARYLRARFAEGREELSVRLERDGVVPGLLDSVRVEPGAKRDTASISASAPTPARAAELLRAVVLQIDAMSTRELEATARRKLRAATGRRAAGLRRYLNQPRSRFGATAVRAERPSAWLDRTLADLPGALPARPSPVWAALAGAAVGFALVAAGVALRRGRRTA